jgi:general secretion pathway protein A
MSYIDFFEFKEHPFRITPDVAFFFTSETHTEAIESLKYFSESNEGFLVLIGEPGTGKTITTRKFLNELPENIEYAYILFPSLEPEDMFKAVLEDFGYEVDGKVSKNTLFSGFRDFLTEKNAQGKKILLVIDEAQNLPVKTLEELRILSNLETEKEKLIQFILCGQPELDRKLDSDDLRQLKQRITLHSKLTYFEQYEMEKYVAFRLSKAGFIGQYPDKKFYKKLHKITEGNPRLVNLVMERALMAAFVQHSKMLSNEHLDSASASLKLNNTNENKGGSLQFFLAGILIILLAFAGYTYYKNNKVLPAKEVTQKISKQQEKPTQEQKEIIQPEPVPTPKAETPKPMGITGFVTVDKLNLRAEPTLNGEVITKLNSNTKVLIVEDTGDWIKVMLNNSNELTEGWVFRKFIRLEIPR